MAKWATEALDWLNHNPQALDTVFIYAYTGTSCALVQYHTWVRRQEPGSLESLKQVRETAMKWEIAVQPGKSILDIILLKLTFRPNVNQA